MNIVHNIARKAVLEALGLPVPPDHPAAALNVIVQAPIELTGHIIRVAATVQAADGAVRTLFSDVRAIPEGMLVVFPLQEDEKLITVTAVPTILLNEGDAPEAPDAPEEPAAVN